MTKCMVTAAAGRRGAFHADVHMVIMVRRDGILWVNVRMRLGTHRRHGLTLTVDDERARCGV